MKVMAFVAVVLLGVVAVVVVLGPHFGYQYAVVKTGSMTPTYPVGTVVMTERVTPESVRVGDVISWSIPGENATRVSHRVVEVIHEGNKLSFRTKGDANEEADPRLVPAASLKGRVIFGLPQVGKLTPLLQQRGLAFGVVVVCGALLIAMEIEKIVRELRGGKHPMATEPGLSDGVIRDYET
jgi:signal peptidase